MVSVGASPAVAALGLAGVVGVVVAAVAAGARPAIPATTPQAIASTAALESADRRLCIAARTLRVMMLKACVLGAPSQPVQKRPRLGRLHLEMKNSK